MLLGGLFGGLGGFFLLGFLGFKLVFKAKELDMEHVHNEGHNRFNGNIGQFTHFLGFGHGESNETDINGATMYTFHARGLDESGQGFLGCLGGHCFLSHAFVNHGFNGGGNLGKGIFHGLDFDGQGNFTFFTSGEEVKQIQTGGQGSTLHARLFGTECESGVVGGLAEGCDGVRVQQGGRIGIVPGIHVQGGQGGFVAFTGRLNVLVFGLGIVLQVVQLDESGTGGGQQGGTGFISGQGQGGGGGGVLHG